MIGILDKIYDKERGRRDMNKRDFVRMLSDLDRPRLVKLSNAEANFIDKMMKHLDNNDDLPDKNDEKLYKLWYKKIGKDLENVA